MQFPVHIGLHRSSFLGFAIVLAHALAAAAVLVPAWPAGVQAALLLAITASGTISWRHRSPAVDRLQLFEDGRLDCRLAGEDAFHKAELRGVATVHPWLTVVPLRIAGRRRALIVLPDSTGREDFRRLRVWLRWRAGFSGPEGVA